MMRRKFSPHPRGERHHGANKPKPVAASRGQVAIEMDPVGSPAPESKHKVLFVVMPFLNLMYMYHKLTTSTVFHLAFQGMSNALTTGQPGHPPYHQRNSWFE